MLGRNMLSMSLLSLYRNIVQFGLSLVLGAFIGPAEFGLVVFTLPFTTLIAMLTDLGLSSAITRMPTVDRGAAGAAFGLTAAVGTGLALAMAAAAGPLAGAIGMPGLPPIMRGMSVAVLAGTIAIVPRAMIERQLRYGRIARIEAVAVMIAAATALAAAWAGAGVWALVLYNVLANLIRAGAFLRLAGQGLKASLDWGRARALASFGGWVLAANLLNFLARNGDNLLIGAMLGPAAVGVYGLAYQFLVAPLMAITWPASAILVASLRDHPITTDTGRRMIEGMIAATALATFPAMLFLTFGLAFPVHALLGPRWQGVPQIVAWLAPLAALQSISSYNGAILLAAGRARMQFWLTALNTALLLATFGLSLPFGMMALVRSFTLVSAMFAIVSLTLALRIANFATRRLAEALAPAMLGTTAALAATRAITGFRIDDWLHWAGSAAAYGATTLIVYLLLGQSLRGRVAILVARPA